MYLDIIANILEKKTAEKIILLENLKADQMLFTLYKRLLPGTKQFSVILILSQRNYRNLILISYFQKLNLNQKC